ncbi:MAG: SMC-Scp complex subunit ScpB [Actinomycetes bacterium]
MSDAPNEESPASDGPDEPTSVGVPSDEARRALEAIVMVADQPADSQLLAQLVELPAATVESTLEALAAEYDEQGRGFRLVKVAGGWRFQSHEELAPYVERFVLSGQSARLSAAALETLAIVAYKQPISRAQVAAIRGVNVDGVMRTLQQRGYIDEVGRDSGPGQASLFGTTQEFLIRLGLNRLDELPSLGDFIPGADVVELLEQGLRVEPEVAESSSDVTASNETPVAFDVDSLVDDPLHGDG